MTYRPRSPIKIVLCGGGNGTHVLAATLGSRSDLQVHLITRKPEAWSTAVECTEHRVWTDLFPYLSPVRKQEWRGRLAGIHDWNDARAALAGADLVLLGCPVHAHGEILERVLPALDRSRNVAVGTLYAQGGFHWLARSIAKKNDLDMSRVTLFGLKRFPFLCKADEPGKHVNLFGRFSRTIFAVDDPQKPAAKRLEPLLADLLGKPTTQLPHLLVCTFTLSNQVLHPGITYGILKDYEPGKTTFPSPPPFYGSTNVAAVRAMFDLGAEIAEVAAATEKLTGMPITRYLGSEPTLAFWMAAHDAILHRLDGVSWFETARDWVAVRAFHHHRRLQPARLPMKPSPTGDGLIPDFGSRFFHDDIPNGLCVIQGLAEILGLRLTRVPELISFHQRWMERTYVTSRENEPLRLNGPDVSETNAPQRYGIETKDELRTFLLAR